MEKDFWLNKWQVSDIAFHESYVNPHLINSFHFLKLPRDAQVLVPLCGKTRDMLWLADQGYQVTGIELSPIACQDFFAEMGVAPTISQENKITKYQHKNITLICGDLFEVTQADLPVIQAIFDCKAMVALPEEMRKKYINQLKKCCGNAFQVFLIAITSPDQAKGPPFSVSSEEIKSLYGDPFAVNVITSARMQDVPERLQKKGYQEITETLYVVSAIP